MKCNYVVCSLFLMTMVHDLISMERTLEQQPSRQTTRLHKAAASGSTTFARLCLLFGSDINARDENNRSPLYLALLNNHSETVEMFLEIPGCNVNTSDNKGRTPLHAAAYNGNVKIVRKLLGLKSIDKFLDNEGITALHLAAARGHAVIVEMLLKHGLKNNSDHLGKTPLRYAAEKGSVEIVNQLLKGEDAAVNAPAIDGATPLHAAAEKGHQFIVALFLDTLGIMINVHDHNGATPLHLAIYNGHGPVVTSLLPRADLDVNAIMEQLKDNQMCKLTPLHCGVYGNHEGIVKALLKVPGINVNVVTAEGATPLDIALQNNGTKASIITSLLLHGARFNRPQFMQRLAHMYAHNELVVHAITKNEERLKQLINSETEKGAIKQALYYAIGQGHVEIAELLISFLDESQLKDFFSHLDLLLKQTLTQQERTFYLRILSLLKQAPKSKDECSICMLSYQETPDMMAKILPCTHKFHSACVMPWVRQGKGCPHDRTFPDAIDDVALDSRLHAAVAQGNLEVVETLLLAGADGNQELAGITPFEAAVGQDRPECVNKFLKYMSINPIRKLAECLLLAAEKGHYEVMLNLIQAGAIVDPHNGLLANSIKKALIAQPLLLFALFGQLDALRPLLDKADIQVLKTALRFAIAQGHVGVVDLLVSACKNKETIFITDEFMALARMVRERCLNQDYQARYDKIIVILSSAVIIEIPNNLGIPVRNLPNFRPL